MANHLSTVDYSPETPIGSFVAEKQVEADTTSYTEEQIRRSYKSLYNRVIKRILGCILAMVSLIILFPVYMIIAVIIILDTGFPVFYKAERGGYLGKPFRIIKYRTMVKNADQIGGGTTALDDPRITKSGAWLRWTKLDEIPQLLNVINGTMSFIGPRPELLRYTNQYEGLEKNILNVRPGITDFSSITYINLDEIVGEQNADEMYEKFVLKKKNQLRLKYVAEVSFKTDVILFLKTVYIVASKAFRAVFRYSSKH